MGLVAPQHVEFSWIGVWSHIPCIGRRILNHCATREVPVIIFLTEPVSSISTLNKFICLLNVHKYIHSHVQTSLPCLNHTYRHTQAHKHTHSHLLSQSLKFLSQTFYRTRMFLVFPNLKGKQGTQSDLDSLLKTYFKSIDLVANPLLQSGALPWTDKWTE